MQLLHYQYITNAQNSNKVNKRLPRTLLKNTKNSI